jgi:hypothetical protein
MLLNMHRVNRCGAKTRNGRNGPQPVPCLGTDLGANLFMERKFIDYPCKFKVFGPPYPIVSWLTKSGIRTKWVQMSSRSSQEPDQQRLAGL